MFQIFEVKESRKQKYMGDKNRVNLSMYIYYLYITYLILAWRRKICGVIVYYL